MCSEQNTHLRLFILYYIKVNGTAHINFFLNLILRNTVTLKETEEKTIGMT